MEYSITQNLTQHYKFQGKERDTETGNDYFGARYYASSMGRFISPDWAGHPEAVPYASLPNPQSLNLYAFTGNNPLSRVDTDGHLYGEPGGTCLKDGTPGDDDYSDGSDGGTSTAEPGDPPPPAPPPAPQQKSGQPAPNQSPTPAPYVTPEAADTVADLMGILNGNNTCANFFTTAAIKLTGDPNATGASILATTNVRLFKDSDEVGGKSEQGGGANNVIFLNKNGPFFNAYGHIKNNPAPLKFGPYSGNQPSTRRLIVLHELAHLTGAIPIDRGVEWGSNENNNTILQHCGDQIQ